ADRAAPATPSAPGDRTGRADGSERTPAHRAPEQAERGGHDSGRADLDRAATDRDGSYRDGGERAGTRGDRVDARTDARTDDRTDDRGASAASGAKRPVATADGLAALGRPDTGPGTGRSGYVQPRPVASAHDLASLGQPGGGSGGQSDGDRSGGRHHR
ncbi:hypothetical protein HF519_15135, partial [Pseudonocardia bannensis]